MERLRFTDHWKCGELGKELHAVAVPHDAMQEKGRSAEAPSGRSEAYFLGGTYVYEKNFTVPDDCKEQILMLEFEGVYPKAEVYLNGELQGECSYGYSMFRVELKNLKYGQGNELRVLVHDEEHPRSRWYGGAGIYRPVWLLKMPQTHIAPAGVRIETISYAPAKIAIGTAVNFAAADMETGVPKTSEQSAAEEVSEKSAYTLYHEIYFRNEKIAEIHTPLHAKCEVVIERANLWNAEHPHLYECRTKLLKDGVCIDEQTNRFGIRKIEWSPNGFFVNGESMKLKGGCLHHDHGILGARAFEKSDWRRIERLKAFGFNAVRSSHNPISRASLEACDTLGIYVMDETWDTWTDKKTPYDFGNGFLDRYETDLQMMVQKDFNHPSVVMYSVGNEVTEPHNEEGTALGKQIIEKLRKLDSTRPLTAGLNLTLILMAKMKVNNPVEAVVSDQAKENDTPKKIDSTEFNKQIQMMGKRMIQAAAREDADQVSTPILNALDICGYNYASSRYAIEGNLHPERIVVGSETFPQDLADNWEMVEKYPYLIGDFMWTAWDYIGEVGLGSWSYSNDADGFEKPYPWLLADSGAFDILGDDTAEAGMASVIWKANSKPYIGVRPVNHQGVPMFRAMWRGTDARPHWSYRNCDGNDAVVEVYTNDAEVELLLNGEVIGRKTAEKKAAVFEIPYHAGILTAKTYNAEGACTAESSLCSASEKTEIQILPEGEAKVGELLYVNINIADENGTIECNADDTLTVHVEGGTLFGFGSANPMTDERFTEGIYTTYYGRSQAVILVESEEVNIFVQGEKYSNRGLAVSAVK
ncbi:MAG: glycoside hydrolase family 2 TIM barrel-domain containing protein [Eubacteriales bacterium]|nr:glycoside hydrolase family 2 TIM barrel-domain containing protein [Eubacteriales bacterium]